MSGAWELASQARVLVGILHVDTTTVAWALGLRNLQIPGGILPISGQPFDQARNTIVQHALNSNATHVFMLDSDVVCPPDTILRLLRHRQPIISGIYYRRSPPEGLPVMMRNGQWVTDFPANSLIEVDVVGSGCLLLSCAFLRDMAQRFPQLPYRPWFCWKVDMKGHVPEGEAMSEDYTLALAARKNGYHVLVDTSIQCRHIGFAQAERGTFSPLCT